MNDNDPSAKTSIVKSPTIRLFGGTYFHYFNPGISFYTIEDIAHSLSHQCRFAGHTAWHYSIAQHSVLGSELIDPAFAYDFLMHDAPEFVMQDLVKPLKDTLPDYQAREAAVEADVFRRFGVANPLPQAVKHMDLVMLVTEQHQVMGAGHDSWVPGIAPADIVIEQWDPTYAKRRFLQRFEELVSRDRANLAA